MKNEIELYNDLQNEEDKIICNNLMNKINNELVGSNSKIWHRNPVWFIDGNPIVGYSKLKNSIQLLFWSGASFGSGLKPVGKYKAAEMRYLANNQINIDDLTEWLKKAINIQWDYKNLVKNKGILERLK